MFEGKYFLFTLEKGIGTLTLNRPPYNIFEAGFFMSRLATAGEIL